jgi:hypothetical protein
MVKPIIYILIFLFSAGTAEAQYIESIVTDRPDQTESAFVVPGGYIQVELGGIYERESYEGGKMEIFSHPALLIRYGLLNNVELRFNIELVQEKFSSGNLSHSISGLLPLSIGTKIHVFKEKGLRPQTAFILHIIFPKLCSKKFANEYLAPDFRATMQHSLSERFSLSYNIGAEWDGNKPNATGIYTLSLGASLTEKIGAFIESYGFLTEKETPDHRLDGGLTYLLTQNFQLDASGGIGITDKSPDYFLGLGISLRLQE